MKALILFGSESDAPIYNALIDSFGESFEIIFEVISAHRQPDRLRRALEEYQYDLVVAGAGLAAHLPGVIASLTKKPVFGIPVAGNFAGLDAFLSIVQMPKGVPVLTVHPKNYWNIPAFCTSVRNCRPGLINIVSNQKTPFLYQKVQEQHPDVRFDVSGNVAEEVANVVLVESENDIVKNSNVIHVPLLEGNDKNDITKALEFFSHAEDGGLWVGANNLINAVNFYKRFWGALQ